MYLRSDIVLAEQSVKHSLSAFFIMSVRFKNVKMVTSHKTGVVSVHLMMTSFERQKAGVE
jgi:hypothetical protein